MMTPRENILRALRRREPEYVPWGLDLCESLRAKLKEERGADDFYAYYQRLHKCRYKSDRSHVVL